MYQIKTKNVQSVFCQMLLQMINYKGQRLIDIFGIQNQNWIEGLKCCALTLGGPQGGRFYVVKRKRRPNSLSNNRRHEEASNLEVEAATASINYQTDKAFHHEAVLDNGERHGEYGYIDPIGIRRVVTYTTGPAAQPSSGIIKAKENDYVGPNTYFEAS